MCSINTNAKSIAFFHAKGKVVKCCLSALYIKYMSTCSFDHTGPTDPPKPHTSSFARDKLRNLYHEEQSMRQELTVKSR